MRLETRIYVGSALYALLVLVGIALTGFVVAPALGTASGLFAIDAESAAFFSLLTLKGAPYWGGLGVASAALYAALARRGALARMGAYAANVVLAWLAGAAVALLALG
jgi:hypothetical protein